MDWTKALFLHVGWTSRYDGSEAPEGSHLYLKQEVGVEADNFRPVDGWCYGYAPVSRTASARGPRTIPKANRTLNITKLGAQMDADEIKGITVVWTARRPGRGPVIVGLYDNATACRYMPAVSDDVRPFIAKARVEDCHLVPTRSRTFDVIHTKKGFPGMAAAWFPGLHQDGPANDMLAAVAAYLPTVRAYDHEGARRG